MGHSIVGAKGWKKEVASETQDINDRTKTEDRDSVIVVGLDVSYPADSTNINKEIFCVKMSGKKYFLEHAKFQLQALDTIPELRKLMRLLNRYQKRFDGIDLQDKVTIGESTVKAKTQPHKNKNAQGKASSTYSVSIRKDSLSGFESSSALAEEFLHVVQYCDDGRSLKPGDMELEAKVLISILQSRYDIYSGQDDKVLKPFLEYFKNPTDTTYNAARNALRSYPFFYDEKSFPITTEMKDEDRLKFVNSLVDSLTRIPYR